MTHDSSQPDIPNHHSLTANLEPRVSYSKEIGEATITHTIFGRAKVRISRKYDNLRRALLLLVLVAVAAAGWQVWLTTQPTEPLQSADSITPVEVKRPVVVPTPRPENVAPVTAAPAMEIAPANPPAQVIAKPTPIQKSAPQPVHSPAGQIAPKPILAVKPQSAPLAVSKTPVPVQPAKPVSQPAAAVAPHAAMPVTQSAASSPMVVVPLASPVGRQVAPSQAPTAAASAPGK